VRFMALILAACALAACADDVVMKNPKTGETTTCPGTPGGVNPWSQNYACAAAHAAQGWRTISEP
jgi:hypothetical protein